MKLYFVAVFLFFCVVGVLSTSPMNCDGCDPQFCPSTSCECGTYKDECNCCDRCFRCPGEECNYFAGERCMLDRECVPPDGLTVMETMIAGRNGVCAEQEDVINDVIEDSVEEDERNDYE